MQRSRRPVSVAVALAFALIVGTGTGAQAGATAPDAPVATASVDELAVVVRAGSTARAAAAVVAVGGTVDGELPIVGGVAARIPDHAVDVLHARPGVEVATDAALGFASADLDVEPVADSAARAQLEAMNLGDGWSRMAGTGVGVALIDTGVIETPALEGRLFHGPDYSDDRDGVDRHGHGTFMAGLIAGDAGTDVGPNGVAPGAHIVSVKLAGRDGVTTLSDTLDAIGWVIHHKDQYAIRVLNLSMGVPTDVAPQADPLSAAVQAAWRAGITVVAASGNEGAGVVTSPGRAPWAITVGASETNGTADTSDDTIADWSGRGKVVGVDKAELVAPGTSVIGLRAPGSAIDEEFPQARIDDDYFRGSGTSMSAALVTGAVATLAEVRPDATPDDLKGALVSTGGTIVGSRSRAVDVAAADAATSDASWSQVRPVASLPPTARGATAAGHPPASSGDTWKRMSWADVELARMSWADAAFARMSWARMSWADAEFARMSWADAAFARMSWARMSWADAEFARMSWARMSWADGGWGDETPGRVAR